MIRIRDLSLPPDGDMARLVQAAARQLRISPNEIKQLDLKKKSVDARKKNDVRIIYTVDVAVKGREDKILKMAHSPKASIARDTLYSVPQPQALPDSQPIIVGFGPAGMFAALVLSMAGLRPLVLERGQDAKTRHEAVSRFWRTGELDPECNVQFGEGGAGTFSDGKLNTGVKNERIGWILEQFAEAGASADILYDAKPHIGTDELVTVVQNLREKILHYGGEIRFGTRLTGIEAENGRITAVRVQSADSETVLPASRVLLAIGHSARDTFEALHSAGVPMEPKPFSMGVRIEHPQRQINENQYGPFADAPGLGAADYKLNVQLPSGGSAYTFCMCPGGYVVAAASEPGGVVTNGMSDHARGPARHAESRRFPGQLPARRDVLAAADRTGGLPRGRKQLPRACAACRRFPEKAALAGAGRRPAGLPARRDALRAARGPAGAHHFRARTGAAGVGQAPARLRPARRRPDRAGDAQLVPRAHPAR